jgi:hypothetical protein
LPRECPSSALRSAPLSARPVSTPSKVVGCDSRLLFDLRSDVIVGVNKYRLDQEQRVEVRAIDNEQVRKSQVRKWCS